MVKKYRRYLYSHERDSLTDTQTDRQHTMAQAALMRRIARQKYTFIQTSFE